MVQLIYILGYQSISIYTFYVWEIKPLNDNSFKWCKLKKKIDRHW